MTDGAGAGLRADDSGRRGWRWAVAVPAIAVIAWLAAWVVPVGQADWRYQSIRDDVRGWSGAGRAPSARAWEGARGILEGAVGLAPGNPVVQEYLGRLHLTEPLLAVSPQLALAHLTAAVGLRPSAPYPWIALLVARYQVGITGKAFEAMLVRLWPLAPSEPGMHVAVADLGLAVWNEMGPEGRAVVEKAVAAGMASSPERMLRISQARGRLFPACAYVRGDRRMAQSPWLKVCDAARTGYTNRVHEPGSLGRTQ